MEREIKELEKRKLKWKKSMKKWLVNLTLNRNCRRSRRSENTKMRKSTY
jgi:hypothetical protein